MGSFGLIPPAVAAVISAGSGQPVTVDLRGTVVSIVPADIREHPQIWWQRLCGWLTDEGLVSTGHRHPVQRKGIKLNRLRFAESLPAKVLVWPSAYTVFIYIKTGLKKGEAALAVRAALAAAGRPPLSAAHSSLIALGATGFIRFSVPKLGTGTVVASAAVAAAVIGGSGLVVTWQAPQYERGGADVSPVSASAMPAHVQPMSNHQSSDPDPQTGPSAFVQPSPSPMTSSPIPTGTATSTPGSSLAPVPWDSSSSSSGGYDQAGNDDRASGHQGGSSWDRPRGRRYNPQACPPAYQW